MTSPSESTVTEEAVKAAAKAIERVSTMRLGMTLGGEVRDHAARAALAAAVPVLFAALADEIDRNRQSAIETEYDDGLLQGALDAADLVRSAAGRWGSDAK